MAIETLEPISPETTGDFFTPQTAEEFEHFRAEELADLLEPVSEDELESVKLHWRGLNPAEGVGLIHGDLDEVKIESSRPNTTLDWHKAIAYNRGGEDLRYNLALGFLPEDDWSIEPATKKLSHDVEELPGALEYQRGNFIVHGKLHRQDVRYVIVRGHGQAPGKVGPVKIYRLRPPAEKENPQVA